MIVAWELQLTSLLSNQYAFIVNVNLSEMCFEKLRVGVDEDVCESGEQKV